MTVTLLVAVQQLNERLRKKRDKAKAIAMKAQELAEETRADRRVFVPFPLGLNLDFRTAPRFERWTDDTYWYVQGNRFVSKAEMEKIRDAYYAQQRERFGGD